MSFLKPAGGAGYMPPTRPVSKVMLKPIADPKPTAPTGNALSLLPSIHSASKATLPAPKPMVGGGSAVAGTAVSIPKKKGRLTKAEKMREKREKASEGIRELLESDPSKADIHRYFEARIEELNTIEA